MRRIGFKDGKEGVAVPKRTSHGDAELMHGDHMGCTEAAFTYVVGIGTIMIHGM